MAPQPWLKEIWCVEIFWSLRRGMANTETLSRREWDRNTPIHKAVGENNRERGGGMNGDRAGFLPRMPARSRRRCIPIHLRVACVCSLYASVWCYVRKKCDVHTAVLTAALSQQGKQQILCEHVCLCEVERGFFFFFGRPSHHTAPL